MDYIELLRAGMEQRERDLRNMDLANEAKRLGLGARGPIAHLDGLLIRFAKGASNRQARREYRSDHREGLLS